MASMREWDVSAFTDVTPVQQDDGPNPVVPISYTHEFITVMDLFRAFLRTNEMSDRALMLSEKVIRINAANYCAWQFRRRVLQHMRELWREELLFCDDIASVSPKNYQLWYHRRVVVTEIKDASFELDHCHSIFENDAKNYHAWAHRQWVISEFNLFHGELEYTNSLLQNDPRNNSAWNQRWFVITKTCGYNHKTIDSELTYSFSHIRSLPMNESPWNYIIGIFEASEFNENTSQRIGEFANNIFAEHNDCRFAAAALVEILEQRSLPDSIQKAIELSVMLAEKIDSIRASYWKFRGESLRNILS